MNSQLKEYIKSMGKLNFYEFMREALFNPDYGYYGSGKARIGKKGDFYTSSSIKLFAWAIGEYFCQKTKRGKIEKNFVEMGGGDGFFAFFFLNYIEKNFPDVFKKMRYFMIEIGKNAGKLAEKYTGKRMKIVKEIEELKPMEGLFFANEFFDSFPARIFKKENGEIYEKFIIYDEGEIKEYYEKLDPESIKDKRINYAIKILPENHTLEYQPDIEDCICKISKIQVSGELILIDYFEKEKNLIYLKPEGTVRCFKNHRILHDPLIFAGDCDITVTVNLDFIISSLKKSGYCEISYVPQWKFLMGCGIENLINKIKISSERERTHIKMCLNTLLSAYGMGEIFSAIKAIKNN